MSTKNLHYFMNRSTHITKDNENKYIMKFLTETKKENPN